MWNVWHSTQHGGVSLKPSLCCVCHKVRRNSDSQPCLSVSAQWAWLTAKEPINAKRLKFPAVGWRLFLASTLVRDGVGCTPGRIAWQKVLCRSVNHDGAPALSRPQITHEPQKLNIVPCAPQLEPARARQPHPVCLPGRLGLSLLFPCLLLASPASTQIVPESLSGARPYATQLDVISEWTKMLDLIYRPGKTLKIK